MKPEPHKVNETFHWFIERKGVRGWVHVSAKRTKKDAEAFVRYRMVNFSFETCRIRYDRIGQTKIGNVF